MMDEQRSLVPRQREVIIEVQPDSNVSWKDIYRFLYRYKLVIALVFCATLASAYVTLSLLTEEYLTEARLLVKLGRENLDPPPTVRNSIISTGVRHEEVASEIQIIKSPDLAERAVDEIGLAAFENVPVKPANFLGQVKFYARAIARSLKAEYHEVLFALDLKKRLDERQTATLFIIENLDAHPEKDSDVVALSMRSPNPDLARRIEERIIDLYMQRRTQVRQYRGVDTFLTNQSDQLRTELARIENQRNEWMRDNKLSATPEQKALLLRQIRDLSAEMNQTQRETEALDLQAAETQKQLSATPVNQRASQQMTPNPLLETLKEKLSALQAQRAHLLTLYLPESDPVKNVDEEIQRMNELIQRESTTQVGAVTYQLNPLHQNLEKNLQDDTIGLVGLRSKASVQSTQIARLQTELRSINDAETKLGELERDRQIAERSYLEFLKRKQDADISTQLDSSRISNVSIIAPPVSSIEPIYPRKLLIMGVVLLLGIILGVAFALLLDYLDDRVYDARALERLVDIPFLGAVSFEDRVIH